MRLSLTAGLAPLVLLASAAPVSGQRPDSARADSLQRPPVYAVDGLVVTVPRPATTTGGVAAVVVRLDSMTVPPAPTLEQVLREMPLIQIRTNSRGEAQPALRGSEDRQVAVLVDGVPLTLGWDHRTDLSIVPLTSARGITLLRGLSSVLHGPNVLGGVIEIDVAAGGRTPAADALSLSGAVDQTGARSLGLAGGTVLKSDAAELGVRAGVGLRQRDGLALADGFDVAPAARRLLTGDGDRRLNSDLRHYDAFVAAGWLREDGGWASLSASAFTAERGVPPEIHEEDPRFWRYPRQARLFAALSGGTGQQATPWGAGDLEASLGLDFGATDIDAYESAAYEALAGGESADDRTLTLRLIGDHSIGAAAELRAAVTLADVARDEVLAPGGPSGYRQRLWSAGTELERVFEQPGLGLRSVRVNLGAAVDGADTPESGDKPPLDRLWSWGGRLGVTAVAREGGLLLHGGISRRTRFPSLRELYSGALGRFLPNPDLGSELLTAGEVGATLRGAATELQAVVFHHRLSDAIVRVGVATPAGEKLQRVNRDELRSTGLELLGSASLGVATLTADLTLQRARLDDPEAGTRARVEYEPEIAGGVGVGVPLPLRVLAGVDVEHMGRQYCVQPGAGGLRPLASSTVVGADLTRGFELRRGGPLDRLDVVLAVDNAADSVVYDQCGLPRPGRTLRLQMRLH